MCRRHTYVEVEKKNCKKSLVLITHLPEVYLRYCEVWYSEGKCKYSIYSLRLASSVSRRVDCAATAGGRVERSFPISLSASPHVRPRSFPRRPQLCVHDHHVVHFPPFMHFIDYCPWAHSSSICAPHTARALGRACPAPPIIHTSTHPLTLQGILALLFSCP